MVHLLLMKIINEHSNANIYTDCCIMLNDETFKCVFEIFITQNLFSQKKYDDTSLTGILFFFIYFSRGDFRSLFLKNMHYLNSLIMHVWLKKYK